ncbi:MAG: AAA family ATPase [Deltaproteobacteria bacterium]|jgi:ATP-dependent exoDNAse (exonuclease V) alpha subunit|nr:AAA family ATPase [Deltaproteobacteria bacterium]
MAKFVGNIELDETNVEFNAAVDIINNGTQQITYLTGKAGTGKTTFLKYIKETTTKNTVILAPTGVAALNAGGQTIHSLFKIAPSIFVPDDDRLQIPEIFDYLQYGEDRVQLINKMELLVIDEISMVRCDILDVIDRILRVYRKRENEPFGGVQVLLIGDVFQLPPIAKKDEWEILSLFYDSIFFFSANVIRKNEFCYIELKKIYRQHEKEFIELLNKVRINQVTDADLIFLNSRYDPVFCPMEKDNYIILSTHNYMVRNTNISKLHKLSTDMECFDAIIKGEFPDSIMPTEKSLELKIGAQIMFIKNDSSPIKRYYNGTITKVKKIERRTELLLEGVEIDTSMIIVDDAMGNEIKVGQEEWKNIKYTWDAKKHKITEEVIGVFCQFPFKLAWAVTVHKSQGFTFEKVIADIGSSFSAGQVYVALSRCTNLGGLVIKTPVPREAIKVDSTVLEFAINENKCAKKSN